MIKDKITSEIKNRFKEDIRKTIETGKEHGFFICKDEKGNLFHSDITCVGDECSIKLGDPIVSCPGKKIQGSFHTHALILIGKKEIIKMGYEILSDLEIKELMERGLAKYIDPKIYSIESPSPIDLLRALLFKHLDITDGTVCTGIDFEGNIECWTAKHISKETFMKVADERDIESKKKEYDEYDVPKKWIIQLFDRDIISLK